jgi:hypothetical protein
MKTKKIFSIIPLFFLLALLLLACSQVDDIPARTVELYYQALVDQDQARMLSNSCADWETSAILEYDGFTTVKTELVDFTCQSIQQEDNIAYVTCEGAISASYDGEIRQFPLDEQTFSVINQGGEWLMCGYE